MKQSALALILTLSVMLALQACERKGGTPPKPVVSMLQAVEALL